MRNRFVIILVALALAFTAASAPARASHHHFNIDVDENGGEAVSVAGETRIDKGQEHLGDVVSVLGKVRLDGRVAGTVVVVLGDLDLTGEVDGDVVSILSHTRVDDSARVSGCLVNVGWTVEGNVESRQVGGEIVNLNFMSLVPFAGKGGGIWGLVRFLIVVKLWLLTLLFLALLLVTGLVPRRLERIATAFPQRWGNALLAGLLACAGAVIGVAILVLTIIGIPLAVVLVCALMITKWLGLAAMLFLIGRTLGRNLFARDLPHVASVLGGFVVYAIACLLPLFGSVFSLAMSIMAVGIAILTRFGSEEFAQRAMSPAAGRPAAPPAPPVMAPPART
jgi:hypothetical protein